MVSLEAREGIDDNYYYRVIMHPTTTYWATTGLFIFYFIILDFIEADLDLFCLVLAFRLEAILWDKPPLLRTTEKRKQPNKISDMETSILSKYY